MGVRCAQVSPNTIFVRRRIFVLTALPEASLGNNTIRVSGLLAHMHLVLIATAGAAANEDDNRREKGADQCSDDAPHGSAIRSLVAAYIIDTVMNNAESCKIAGQRNNGNNKG